LDLIKKVSPYGALFNTQSTREKKKKKKYGKGARKKKKRGKWARMNTRSSLVNVGGEKKTARGGKRTKGH